MKFLLTNRGDLRFFQLRLKMVGEAFCLLLFIGIFVGFISRSVSRDGGDTSSNSRNSSSSIPITPRSEGEILQSANLKSFTYSELRTSTRNFRPDSILGEGGFGSVFKGWIDEHSLAATKPGIGIVIAVKRLNQDGFQGHKEWLVGFFFPGKAFIYSCNWILDIACIFHMSCNREWFTTSEPRDMGIILIRNDAPYKIVDISLARIKIHDGIIKMLEGVRHIPVLG